MPVKITQKQLLDFFEAKEVGAHCCTICNKYEMKAFATTIDEQENPEIFVFKNESEVNISGSVATSHSVKLFCGNCGYETLYNAEIIAKWAENQGC